MSWIPYIGQKIIWVGENGTENIGPTVITGIRKSPCRCDSLELETPIASDKGTLYGYCSICGLTNHQQFVGKFRMSFCFRPFEEFDDEAWLEEIESNSQPFEHPVFGKIELCRTKI